MPIDYPQAKGGSVKKGGKKKKPKGQKKGGHNPMSKAVRVGY